MKVEPQLTHIPIMGVSAHALTRGKDKALSAGCDAYLTKPLHDNLLFNVLEKLLLSEAAS